MHDSQDKALKESWLEVFKSLSCCLGNVIYFGVKPKIVKGDIYSGKGQ